MLKKKLLYIFVFLAIFMITGCHTKDIKNKVEYDNNDEIETNLYGSLGSAGSIIGTTLIVSIYTDDAKTSWKTDTKNTMESTLSNLTITTNWLEEQVKDYGKESKFIYDWHEYSDIKYTAKFDDFSYQENTDGNYFYQRKWIEDNIDVIGLKKKYQYDNIIFIFFFNMESINEFIRSNASNIPWEFDVINIFVQDNIYTPVASYAHEILHTYGAPDLYYENLKITKDYVDYVDEFRHDDIMYSVNCTKEITNIFSEVDAYYVGLIDECTEVKEWNLAKSDHLTS